MIYCNLELNPLRSANVQSEYPEPTPYVYIRVLKTSYLELDISRSFKVKFNDAFRLPIYDFLLVFGSIIWPNSAHL